MKLKIFKSLSVCAIFLLAASCTPETKYEVSPGKADFSKFISVGNSLTAGFSNGTPDSRGLYEAAQKYAFPVLMYDMIKEVDPDSKEFVVPYLPGNGTGYNTLKGFDENGSPIIQAVEPNEALQSPSAFSTLPPLPIFPTTHIGRFKLKKHEGPLSNFGVPGIRLAQITDKSLANDDILGILPTQIKLSLLSWNPYYEMIAPNKETSYLELVGSQDHTFFTCFIGNNDILGYALAGGDNPLLITPEAAFETLYDNLIKALVAKGQKGIVATIPSITSAAHFTTVNTAKTMAAFKEKNKAGLFIETADGPRLATDKDLLLLSAAATLAEVKAGKSTLGASPLTPLPTNLVLDTKEIETIIKTTEAYNNIIKAAAEKYDLAVADVNTFFDQANPLKGGIVKNGIPVTSNFISGGVFSLDGIHLTPRGNAVLAGFFIDNINAKYGSRLRKPDPGQYPGIPLK